MAVVIETTKGTFTVDLYIEQRPKVCKNFLKLCKSKYYNFCLFHDIQSNFIAQTGDPTGTGRGGESVYGRLFGDQARYFEGEQVPKLNHIKYGTLSMVGAGENMYGSQFFVTLGENLDYLDGNHCVFGEVTEGLETLEQLNEAICDNENRPYQDIRITHTVILEDPFEDPDGLEVPPMSPEPSKEMLASSRIGADEDLDPLQGKTEEELAELEASKDAKARAEVLELVGDLPDADCAPPENVLFVCKLNPVTSDDDLEIIFARFGKVKSCEVIRDHKSGESLQYAFVEFEDQKACESAYFKMDNVLIDDRRIHVDFSQSVSKYRWKGKGRLEVLDDKKGGKGQERNARGGEDRKGSYGRKEDRSERNDGYDGRRNREFERRDNDRRHYDRRDSERRNNRRNDGGRDRRDQVEDRRDRNDGRREDRFDRRRDDKNGARRERSESPRRRDRSRDRRRSRSKDRSGRESRRSPVKEKRHRRSPSSESEEERTKRHKKAKKSKRRHSSSD